MKPGCEGKLDPPKKRAELPVIASSGGAKPEIAKSRMGRWRAGALIVLHILMAAHIVQWLYTGSTVSPIEPSETMWTLQQGAVNAGAIFFALAIIATLVLGRFVCGWACHVVALQDLCAWMLKKIGLTPRPFRSRLLIFVPLIAALYMFVWPTVLRAIMKPENEPLIPPFSNHLITTEFWATFPPIEVAIPFLFICGFITVYFLGSKGFCTYGCPYGGFFAVADKFAPGRIRVTDACNECGHCTATCTSNVVVHAEVKKYGMVVDPGCMKCMDCVSVCPNDALYFGFGKPSVAVTTEPSAKYSLTWPEEIFAAAAFVAAYFAVWNVYQLVPMLMAIGIAIVTAFLAVKTLHLFRRENLVFYRWSLRSKGSLMLTGYIFIAFAAAWIGLNAHSGWVRYHESAGTRAFENIRVPDELALLQSNPQPWLSLADQGNIAEGRRHLQRAAEIGLFTNADAMPKLAWMEYLAGNKDRALELLSVAADRQSGQQKALSLFYRGAILNRSGRFEEGLRSHEAALAERPDLSIALEDKGESLWMLGRREEAVAAWQEAIRQRPNLPIASNFIAGAAATSGNAELATELSQMADRATPRDPLFQFMLGQRLQNVGMAGLAERRFEAAFAADPTLRGRRSFPTAQPR